MSVNLKVVDVSDNASFIICLQDSDLVQDIIDSAEEYFGKDHCILRAGFMIPRPEDRISDVDFGKDQVVQLIPDPMF